MAAVPAAPPLDDLKLRTFCAALLKANFNATAAYLEVSPTVTRESAATAGYLLLRNPETQRILAEVTKAAWERNELDPAYIIGCWVAMSRANVMDYFEADAKGQLTLRNLSALDPVIQRNVSQLEVTTERVNEMVTSQKVKLKLVDRRQVLDSMAKAAELFGPLGGAQDSQKGIADAITEGFERVRKRLGGRTFDAQGIDITSAQEATG